MNCLPPALQLLLLLPVDLPPATNKGHRDRLLVYNHYLLVTIGEHEWWNNENQQKQILLDLSLC